MKPKWVKFILRFSAVFLPLSMGFVAVSITLVLLGNYRMHPFTISLVALVSGVFLWISGMIIHKRARFFFAATFLFLTGILLLLLDFNVLDFPARGIWPLLMLFVGTAFTVSGYLHYRKIHAMYIVPSLVFSVLGFVFLLFSTDIITFSLRSLVMWWLPLLFIPSLVSLIVWLIQRKKAVKNGND
ncbi:MAG TPA: hypothetical protein GXZ47_02525 [Treponema sp.]|nr:hypothetical protein [Treponema sp.]